MVNEDKNGNEIISKRKKKKEQTSVCPFQTTISNHSVATLFVLGGKNLEEGPITKCITSKWIHTLAWTCHTLAGNEQSGEKGVGGGNGLKL